MSASARAPKQWCLTKSETITSFESWKSNLKYCLTMDTNFAPFLADNATWQRYSKGNPTRGFTDDGQSVPEGRRKTAHQKVQLLELMLGQIANYCPIISRNMFIQKSTSMESIWQTIRSHYGFQRSGAHFLDFAEIRLEPDERPEDLFQRITSFIDDNLLKAGDKFDHHGSEVTEDEETSATVENLIVVTWLQTLHKDLPRHVKQRYGTELRSRTLASIKPEISQALSSLMDEVHAANETRVMRSYHATPKRAGQFRRQRKVCPLCKAAKRRNTDHYLSQCSFLPDDDRRFINTHSLVVDDDEETNEDSERIETVDHLPPVSRVSIKCSPSLQVRYNSLSVNLTLDSGATANLIRESTATRLMIPVVRTSHQALQADGVTRLPVIGEISATFMLGRRRLVFTALVVRTLSSEALAGMPFFVQNDVGIRPSRNVITLGNEKVGCLSIESPPTFSRSQVLRTKCSKTIWPGDNLALQVTDTDHSFVVESLSSHRSEWPNPHIVDAVDGMLYLVNDTDLPINFSKHGHVSRIVPLGDAPPSLETLPKTRNLQPRGIAPPVAIDPDGILDDDIRARFSESIQHYANVFTNTIGVYSGSCGDFEAVVNMGRTAPPQRKGRVPQYSRDRLLELQQKCDLLESQGVLRKPEELGISVEYLNPSFLVNKPRGGTRLVTAFSDVARYCKPQPSLMPDVESTIRKIAGWKYLIKTDLTSAYYQIPLSKSSMKYCGIVTPYKGTRVYTRCAMGMPGSETALEELMSRIVGDLLQEGKIVKIADDLYCGGSHPIEALENWLSFLEALSPTGLHLSADKTVICPKETMLLGWVWQNGKLRASSHRISSLSNCEPPKTVKGLRSFIGAYKVLSKVIPRCSSFLAPLDRAVAGKDSSNTVEWSDTLHDQFKSAQRRLHTNDAITLPSPDDELWIVTDASPKEKGLGATLYSIRNGKKYISDYFSARLRSHQHSWIPCEIEALGIAAALKHFGPYVLQSKHAVGILTDSKPCVQAVEKLQRGEFSTSARIYSFLASVCQYRCFVKHLPGSANLVSDFSSRNAPDCVEKSCQICRYVEETKLEPVVNQTNINDIVRNKVKLPYTNRRPWLNIQSECGNLRRTKAHLKQGTRPSKKDTNARDVKRYLRDVTISNDGLFVVQVRTPLSPVKERIVIPRKVLAGVLMALHLKLDHPSISQLQQVVSRYFFALDLHRAVSEINERCHTCLSLRDIVPALTPQSTCSPPCAIGERFAADVLKREKQCILVVRETVSSFTKSIIITDERADTLRNALVMLCLELRPLNSPNSVIRTDAATSFSALTNDPLLDSHGMSVETGRSTNVNKNPVAEKAIQELSREILKIQGSGYHGGPVTPLQLQIATCNLNNRIRGNGVSAREILLQRDQFTNLTLPINDVALIKKQQERRTANHPSSEAAKAPNRETRKGVPISVGDIVYLYNDKKKHRCRDRYLVLSIEGDWCDISRFGGKLLSHGTYRVRQNECFLVPNETGPTDRSLNYSESDCESTEPEPPAGQYEVDKAPAPDEGRFEVPIPDERQEPILEAPDVQRRQPDTPSESSPILPRRSQRTRRRPFWHKEYVINK